MKIRNTAKMAEVLSSGNFGAICGAVPDGAIIFKKGDQLYVEYWFTALESPWWDSNMAVLGSIKEGKEALRKFLWEEFVTLKQEDEFRNGPLRLEKEAILKAIKLLQ